MDPIEIPPGIVTKATKVSMSSNWRDGNLIRWKDDRLTPVGGWEEIDYGEGAFESRIRAVHTWSDNTGNKYVAYLCEAHLYVDIGGELSDVSPVDPIVPPYSDVTAGGYGDYLYSYDTYGTPRPEVERERTVSPCYTLDNWGETLLAMTSPDGRLLQWDPSAPTDPALAVVDAPVANRTFVVTPERFVMVFGKGGDARKFGWSQQEDINNWTIASVTSKAGEYDVEPAAPILSAKVCRDGVLMFTTVKAYLIRFVGLPYIYSYEPLIDGCIPISTASLIATGAGVIWPSESNFWMYDGGTIIPIDCPIWDTINISLTYGRYEAAGVNVSSLSELWWFYPSTDERFADQYVIYNYAKGWWSRGKLSRSCGVSSAYDTYPIMCVDTRAFRHESGLVYPDAPELPFAETFNLNLQSGSRMVTIDQMIPNVEGDVSDVRISFLKTDDRSRGVEVATPKKMIRANGWLDVRETGRDFRMRITSETATARWTSGQHLIGLIGRGSK